MSVLADELMNYLQSWNGEDWSRGKFLELSLPISNLLGSINDLTSGPEFKYEFMEFNGTDTSIIVWKTFISGKKIQIRVIFFSRKNCNCTIVKHDFLRRLIRVKNLTPRYAYSIPNPSP